MTPAGHRPGVLPAPGAALALPGPLNTLARQLNTLPARVNTFAVKLNTFPPTVNTSASQGEHIGGQAGHLGRQTGHISGHTGLIGRETGHIGGSAWTHPLPSSTHPGAGRRCTTVAGIQPPPPRSLPVRCLRYRALLAIRSPIVYNLGVCLAVRVPMPNAAPPHTQRISPRRPSPSAALVLPPCPRLCSPRPGSSPRNSRDRAENPLQTVSRQPDPLRGSGWRETVPPFTPIAEPATPRPQQPGPASRTPRRMISAGFLGDR